MISGKVTPDPPLLLALLVMFSGSLAAADFSLDMLMGQFTLITTADARFREEKQLALLDTPLVMEGRLSFRAPDYLKKEVLEPEPSLYEIRGDSLHIEAGNEQRTLALDSHPLIRAFAESWRAILSGNGAALERYFDTELSGSLDNWTLRLLPRDPQARDYIEAIIIRGRRGHIHSAETREASGDSTRLTITPDDG